MPSRWDRCDTLFSVFADAKQVGNRLILGAGGRTESQTRVVVCCDTPTGIAVGLGRPSLGAGQRSAAHKSILNVNRTHRQRPAHGGPFGARGLGHHYFLPGVSSVVWFRWTPERRSSWRVGPAQGQGDSERRPSY